MPDRPRPRRSRRGIGSPVQRPIQCHRGWPYLAQFGLDRPRDLVRSDVYTPNSSGQRARGSANISRARSRWRTTVASCVHRSRSTFARSRGSISALSASPTSLPSRQRPSSLPPRRDGLLRDESTFVDPVLPPGDLRHRRRRSVPHRSIDAGRCRGTPMARIASRWSDAGIFGVDLAGVLRGLAWPEAEPSRAAMHPRLDFTPHPSSPDAQHRGGARLLRPRRARPIRPIGPSPPGNRAPLPSPAP